MDRTRMRGRELGLRAALILALSVGFVPQTDAARPEEPVGEYLVVVALDDQATLERLALEVLTARFVSERFLIVETSAAGLARLQQGAKACRVLDHPVDPEGYVLIVLRENERLPEGLPAGARLLWTDEQGILLYKGLDAVAAVERHPDLRVSSLPARIGLRSYLRHEAPPVIREKQRKAGGWLRPSTISLEARLRAHMRELSWNDTTGTYRSRYAFRAETRDHAASYIREAFLDALGGRGEVLLPGGFRCGPPDSISPGPNIVARLPGEGHGKIVVSAHYDAIASRTPGWDPQDDPAPGADDNASGIAATIEILRLVAPLRFEFDLEFAAWACEEILPDALWGSRAYAQAARAEEDSIWGVINLDMLGYNASDEHLRILTNTGSQWLADLLLETGAPSAWPGTVGKVLNLERPFSDHNSFWDVSYDAVTILEDLNVRTTNPMYHTVDDTTGEYRLGQVTAAVSLVAGALSALANRPTPDLAITEGSVKATWPGPPYDRNPDPGDSVAISAVVRNLGESMGGPANVRVGFFARDASGREEPLGEEEATIALLLGEEAAFHHSWVVPQAERGTVTLIARLLDILPDLDFDRGNNETGMTVAIRQETLSLFDSYCYPNPVSAPEDFRLHFQLSHEGDVAVSIFTLEGARLAQRWFYYQFSPTDERPQTGVNEYTWTQIAPDIPFPASGLYLLKVEAQREDGENAGSALLMMAVKR